MRKKMVNCRNYYRQLVPFKINVFTYQMSPVQSKRDFKEQKMDDTALRMMINTFVREATQMSLQLGDG